MKTQKVKIEVCHRKGKIYVQIYLKDTEILLHTYIIREEDTLQLTNLSADIDCNKVSDFT